MAYHDTPRQLPAAFYTSESNNNTVCSHVTTENIETENSTYNYLDLRMSQKEQDSL